MSYIDIKTNPVIPSPTQIKSQVRDPLLIRGSIPYWDQAQAIQSFQDNVNLFNSISVFWYFLTKDGRIQKYEYATEDLSIVKLAHKNNQKVSVVITNLPEGDEADWDSPRVERMLINTSTRQRTIDSIDRLTSRLSVDGVTIDFEEVDQKMRADFSGFILELSQKMIINNKFVGVTLHPKTGAYSDKQYFFQDWNALATSAAELYIMAYGEHWDNGSPGPIASTEWIKSIISYTKGLNVPLSKFYLGIPLYGYDWELGSDKPATGLIYVDITRLMQVYSISEEWGQPTASPFFRYSTGGKIHEVWFENAASVEEKLSLASEAGFGGVTFWRLGGEDPGIWDRVRQIQEVKKIIK